MSANQDELVLRDLQTLLGKSLGEDVVVVDYATKSLLPQGENYGSTMMKVDAVVKRTRSSKEEELPLVAKMIPTTEFQKEALNITGSFAKEIFVFEKLIPKYRQLERKAGVKEEELMDILPKFYGGRLTRNEETPGVADEDSVLLMENLKVRGYYTADRKNGMDLEHASLAIRELARYHALGVALRQREPEFFEASRGVLDVFPFDVSSVEDVVGHTTAMILEEPRVARHAERVKASMELGWQCFLDVGSEEPWISVSHGDFWVNNMMFRKDKNGKLVDIKFVDFQLSRVGSPLQDLPYFLCGSVRGDVINAHFDSLLDLYYGRFVETLQKIGCDATPFTRRSFNEQLRKDGRKGELFHCLLAAKFFTMDVKEDDDLSNIKDSIMLTRGSKLFLDRAAVIVEKFVEQDWI